MKQKAMIVYWALFSIFGAVALAGYFGKAYYWNRISDITESGMPPTTTEDRLLASHTLSWKTVAGGDKLTEAEAKLFRSVSLVTYCERAIWFGGFGLALTLLMFAINAYAFRMS